MTDLLSRLTRFDEFFDRKLFLGQGDYGEVFSAQSKTGPEQYAIKQISVKRVSESILDSIRIEGNLLKGKKLPNVIEVLGLFQLYDQTGAKFYGICMEYFQGSNLREVWQDYCSSRERKTNEYEENNHDLFAIDLMIGVTTGLNALHSEGIAHRDIKPANILYHQGQIKIIDLGFICSANTSRESREIRGTPLYFSPEIARQYLESREIPFDFYLSGDIWALGVTMSTLIFSPPNSQSLDDDYFPFDGSSLASLCQNIIDMKRAPMKTSLSVPNTTTMIGKCLSWLLSRPKSSDLLNLLQKTKKKMQ
jgi:serine/threonine protein kinase